MKRLPLVILVALATSPLWAQGKKSAHQESKKESGSSLKQVQDGANKALDGVEKGVKEGASAVATGANKALQAVDDTLHGRKEK